MNSANMDAAFVAEALRLHKRYSIEVVEQFNFCPWARASREKGRTYEQVLSDGAEETEVALAAVEAMCVGYDDVEIGQLIFPNCRLDAMAFERFFSKVRNAHYELHGGRPVWVMAAFHPGHRVDMTSGETAVALIRKTPDPTIQLARFSIIAPLRASSGSKKFVLSVEEFLKNPPPPPEPDVTERITATNYERVQLEGLTRVLSVVEDIIADRERSYAGFTPAQRGLVHKTQEREEA